MVIIIVLVAVRRFVQAGWEGLLAPTAGKRCHSPRRVTARLMQVKFSSSLHGGWVVRFVGCATGKLGLRRYQHGVSGVGRQWR